MISGQQFQGPGSTEAPARGFSAAPPQQAELPSGAAFSVSAGFPPAETAARSGELPARAHRGGAPSSRRVSPQRVAVLSAPASEPRIPETSSQGDGSASAGSSGDGADPASSRSVSEASSLSAGFASGESPGDDADPAVMPPVPQTSSLSTGFASGRFIDADVNPHPSPPLRRRRPAQDSDPDFSADDDSDSYDYSYDYEYTEEEVVDDTDPQIELGDDEVIHVDFEIPDAADGEDRFVTPSSVQQGLAELDLMNLRDLPDASLTIAVRDQSRWSPEWADGKFRYPLFLAFRTSRDRPTRSYRCRHEKCPAQVDFSVDKDGEIHLVRQEHRHSHRLVATSVGGANSLSRAQRQKIIEYSAIGLSVRNIRRAVGATAVSADAIYDCRRPQLKASRENQSAELFKLVQAVRNASPQIWNATVNSELDGTFTDSYFFHTRLLSVSRFAFLDAWVMDDAANTNLLKFPFIGILGVDERNCNQLLAFALVCDRTIQSFSTFLEWIKPQLPPPVNMDDPVPVTFMVDRHRGQSAAISQTYPRSLILFWALHLAASIKKKFPQNQELVDWFWKVVDGKIGINAWQEYLEGCMEKANPKQKKLLITLHDEYRRYCAEFIDKLTTLKVSSRAEGTFGNYRVGEGHVPGTLAHTAQAFMEYGDKWRIEHAHPVSAHRKLFVSEEFLSRIDQLRLGPKIGELLAQEVAKSISPRRPGRLSWIATRLNRGPAVD
jgi:hypothetical protein